MDDLALADIKMRLRRLERHIRVLIVLLCASLAVGSIAVSNAQPTVITASEVRAQRFSLLDPNGGLADDWYTTPTNNEELRHINGPYSGWSYSKP